jgi:3-(3-hydroxy-phenyl)propionate hydroxylase
MSATAEFDVAVVGCGPVGALAANLFGQAGLRTIVIERQDEPYPMPRAVHIDHEMMRIFQSLGLVETMLPLMREGEGHIHIGADGGVIRYLGSKGLPKRFGWANDYFFYQPELESELRRTARVLPTVTMRIGAFVRRVSQTAAKVSVVLDDDSGCSAAYLVACDGASSFVRKALGIPLVDLNFDEPWLVVDAMVKGDIRFPPFTGVPEGADLQHLSVMLCDPKRPATLVPGRASHRRWEFMLLPGEDDQAMMQPGVVKALTAPYLAGIPHELVRAATYRFHGLVARHWQDGRVFLAGDAAHQTPPFFGQGMCHGFRDVMNLSWKLAAVLRGDAQPALLATYQEEREPHVRAVVEAAIATGRYICELDPERARARDEALRAAMGKPAPKSASDLIPPIKAGVIARDASRHLGTGARFIQPYVMRNGGRLLFDDATEGEFVLIARDKALLDAVDGNTRAFWQHIGGHDFALDDGSFTDTDGSLGGWLIEHDAQAVLLRPDFYVFGTARDARETGGLIEQLRGFWKR